MGIAAYGAELQDAFINAACGLFSLMTDLDRVKDELCLDVEVTADNQEDLLVEWLNELIYLFEVENVLFKRFDITELTDTKLKAACHGERIARRRHEIKLGVKAATYHMLNIEKGDGYRVQVLFDI